jgi:hypothetical protein
MDAAGPTTSTAQQCEALQGVIAFVETHVLHPLQLAELVSAGLLRYVAAVLRAVAMSAALVGPGDPASGLASSAALVIRALRALHRLPVSRAQLLQLPPDDSAAAPLTDAEITGRMRPGPKALTRLLGELAAGGTNAPTPRGEAAAASVQVNFSLLGVMRGTRSTPAAATASRVATAGGAAAASPQRKGVGAATAQAGSVAHVPLGGGTVAASGGSQPKPGSFASLLATATRQPPPPAAAFAARLRRQAP